MIKFLLIRLIGIAGLILVIVAYWLLWSSAEIELEEVIRRTKIAIVMGIFGNLMILFYIYKR